MDNKDCRISIAFLPALSALFSYKGSDNFTILIIIDSLFFYIENFFSIKVFQTIFVITSIFGLACIAYYKKWLTFNGAIAAIFIGTVVVFTANVLYLLPLSLFLISGSLASKLLNDKKEKTGRNAKQVFANGLVAIVCIIAFNITENETYKIAFFASIAISMADTLSSDIGRYYKQKTYNIINFKPIAVGLSGGVSFAGTIAGFAAAIVFGIAIFFIFNITTLHTITIIAIGFLGMLIDSVLGSLLQAKYKNVIGIITENNTGKLVKGLEWCNNDVVNVLSNIITIAIYVLISLL